MPGGSWGTAGEFFSEAAIGDLRPEAGAEERARISAYSGEAIFWLCRSPGCPSRFFQPLEDNTDERSYARERPWIIPPVASTTGEEEGQRETEDESSARFWTEDFEVPVEPEGGRALS